MGGTACKKIIINGRVIMTVTDYITESAEKADAAGEYVENSQEITELFNQMEDLAFKALHLYLDGTGFKGPWSNSLTFKEEK